MKFERADLTHERTFADGADIRAALDKIRAGNLCQECKWQPATTVVRRKLLLCASCAKVDRATRSIEATYIRIHRKDRS